MWTSRILEDARLTRRVALEREGVVASYRDVLDAWQSDPEFCAWFGDELAASKFSAFRWETPPITERTAHRPFEYVLLNEPGLARPARQADFAEHFRADPVSEVLAFDNLGGDAIMIVPRPLVADDAYVHLAAFVRHAPPSQRTRLWMQVGRSMAERLSDAPVWLSTAGAGVPWLHVRLDDRPKYYGFADYRPDPRDPPR